MKFQDGENRFRILSSPIIGWEWWEEKEDGTRKPIRVTMDTKIPVDSVDPATVRHFWAMSVWNYKEEKIQILEITQKSIQKSIKALAKDEDWGSPLNYDLVVTKSGEKLETEYQVQPKPAKKLDAAILQLFKDMAVNLNALYEGGDPFASESEKIAEDAHRALS
ncbi:MAG: hypothetical protein KGI58_04040 [Patescibacteria group bacterium]|nr:hypothetical protein [Patescibacteria group bacterium]